MQYQNHSLYEPLHHFERFELKKRLRDPYDDGLEEFVRESVDPFSSKFREQSHFEINNTKEMLNSRIVQTNNGFLNTQLPSISKVECRATSNSSPFQLQKRRVVDSFSQMSLNSANHHCEKEQQFHQEQNLSQNSKEQYQQDQIDNQDQILKEDESTDADMELSFRGSEDDSPELTPKNKGMIKFDDNLDRNVLFNQFQHKRTLDFLFEKDTSAQPEFKKQILQVHSSLQRKELIKSFFNFYLTNILKQNNALLNSYMEQMKLRYTQVSNKDRITFSELQESIQEMDLDMEEQNLIYDLLAKETNINEIMDLS